MVLSFVLAGLTMYGIQDAVKGVRNQAKRNQLEYEHQTRVDDVLDVIGGKRYLLTQPQIAKKRYLNYLHRTYGLNNKEREMYSKKFDRYYKIIRESNLRTKKAKKQNAKDEYTKIKEQSYWRKEGASFKIELYKHCRLSDVDWKMKKTIDNSFLKEIIGKAWTYDGYEILRIDNVKYSWSNKRKIEKWYEECWIAEHGKWTY